MTTSRIASVFLVVALIAAACTGGTPTAAPTTAAPPTDAATDAPTDAPEPTDAATTEPTDAPTTAPTDAGTAEPTGTASTETQPPPGEEAELRWYCCLGTGEAPEQVPTEEKVAADFSAASANANLTFEVTTYEQAYDVLATQIQGGNPPDLVGPVGVGGLQAFQDQWLDLQPLIDSTGFDVSVYDPTQLEQYNTEDGQIGLPFALYPSMLWYNTALFDEAGLEYPPHAYGDPYVMPDGTEVEWNYETVREIAMLLTVDENGTDATSPDFDPDAIDQVGFEPQRDDLRQTGAFFGAGSLVAEDGVTARVPDPWRDAWKYFYDAMWVDHFSLTGPVFEEDEWSVSGYPFHSGRVAMSTNYLWSKYGVGAGSGVEGDWDLAAVPSHNGQTTAALNRDTFVIMEGTQDPEAAFEALTYLQTEAATTLTDLYGAIPAIESEQDAFFASLDEEFPHGPDWQVAKDSLDYLDMPSFESFMPKYNETLDVLNTYGTKWETTPGLDLDAEIAALEAELTTLWSTP